MKTELRYNSRKGYLFDKMLNYIIDLVTKSPIIK